MENETLITDSQEIAAICEHLGIHDFADEITGVLVDLDKAVNGEITENDVRLTDSSKPWSIHAHWERPSYFEDYVPEELDLQE